MLFREFGLDKFFAKFFSSGLACRFKTQFSGDFRVQVVAVGYIHRVLGPWHDSEFSQAFGDAFSTNVLKLLATECEGKTYVMCVISITGAQNRIHRYLKNVSNGPLWLAAGRRMEKSFYAWVVSYVVIYAYCVWLHFLDNWI